MDWILSSKLGSLRLILTFGYTACVTLTLAIYFMYFYTLSSFSHEKNPSILEFELESNQIFITIQMDLLFLFGLGSIDHGSSLSDADINEKQFISDLTADESVQLIFQEWDRIRSKLHFNFDNRSINLHLLKAELGLPEPGIEEKTVFLQIKGNIPQNSLFLTFSWDRKFGDLLIRQKGNADDLFRDYVPQGTQSAKFFLE